MNKTTSRQIRKNLNHILDLIRGEIAQVGATLRNLRTLGGDTEYAEDTIIWHLTDETDWDGWEDFDQVLAGTLFQKAVRYQAAYNTFA